MKIGQRAKVKDGLIFVFLTQFVGEAAKITDRGAWKDGDLYIELTYKDGTRIKWRREYVVPV